MEAREKLRDRRKRARPAEVNVVHAERQQLDVELPKTAGRALCGPYWVPLGSTESPQARAGRTVVVPGTTKIEKT